MLQAARRNAPEGPLSGGFAGSMYQGLADEEYARLIAARGGFGLGDMMYNQMWASLEAKKAYAQQPAAVGTAKIGAQGTSQRSDN